MALRSSSNRLGSSRQAKASAASTMKPFIVRAATSRALSNSVQPFKVNFRLFICTVYAAFEVGFASHHTGLHFPAWGPSR